MTESVSTSEVAFDDALRAAELAAEEALDRGGVVMESALEAAAPHIDRAARTDELKRWVEAYKGHEYPDPGDESDYNLGFLAVVDDLKKRIAELEGQGDE